MAHYLAKKNESIKVALHCQKQKAIEEKNDERVQFGSFIFDQEVLRSELACAIIMLEYHFSIAKYKGFRRFVASLQPLFKMVSHNTIEGDIIKM